MITYSEVRSSKQLRTPCEKGEFKVLVSCNQAPKVQKIFFSLFIEKVH